MNTEQLVLGGERVAAANGKTFAVIEPGTGRPFAEVAEAGLEDVERAVQMAYRTFEQGQWPRMSATERGRILLRAAVLVRQRLEELAVLEARNAGKPIRDARGEIGLAANVLEYWGGAANKIFGETIPVQDAGLEVTLREPVGVCALITPWNFPLVIACWKIAPALACGNTIIVKPAQLTPLVRACVGRYPHGGGTACGRYVGAARPRRRCWQRAGHQSHDLKGLLYRLDRSWLSDHAPVRGQYHPRLA